jgi:hypothetical protein
MPNRCVFAAWLIGVGVGVTACSSGSPARAPSDAGLDVEAAIDSGDSGVPDVGPVDAAPDTLESADSACAPNATFTPYAWEPPTPFYQAACNAMQLGSYLSCFQFGDCAPFKGVPANAGCVACIETDVSAPAHGPVITVGGAIQEVNFGGCQATFDGDRSATSCGATFNDLNSCVVNECGDCPDVLENGPQFEACYKAAFATGGPCTKYDETPACRAETSPGGVAASCDAISTFLPAWCGSVPGDGGDEGGG